MPQTDAPLTEEELEAFAAADGAPLVEEFAIDLGQLLEAQQPAGVQLAERNVFDERGVGRIAIIRPCISRGKKIRGLSPIYTPQMLEANAGVFTGWPMYMDHVPQRLAEMLEEAGRSMRELGGQILRSWWDANFTHPADGQFGYQRGGVLAEVWATPFIRKLVGNNPSLLHTSINAWPKAGKPGNAPWAPAKRGMVIEGIRSEPQGSVDFVPRGGAGGRLLAEDERLVVSVANEVYNSAQQMPRGQNDSPDFANMTPAQLAEWAREHHPHLAEAIQVEERQGGAPPGRQTPPAPAAPAAPTVQEGAPPAADGGLSEADVRRLIDEGRVKPDDVAEQVREAVEEASKQAREHETRAARAKALVEASTLPKSFKADLISRYTVLPSGPQPSLLVEADQGGKDGAERSELEVLEANVKADIDHMAELVAEARGKPRVTGEGGADPKQGGEGTATPTARQVREGKTPLWRERFAELGIVESADDALVIHGVEKVEES